MCDYYYLDKLRGLLLLNDILKVFKENLWTLCFHLNNFKEKKFLISP